jgi:hypothetical protein
MMARASVQELVRQLHGPTPLVVLAGSRARKRAVSPLRRHCPWCSASCARPKGYAQRRFHAVATHSAPLKIRIPPEGRQGARGHEARRREYAKAEVRSTASDYHTGVRFARLGLLSRLVSHSESAAGREVTGIGARHNVT